ncbi:MAG: hypothetical protein FWE82_05480 [Defluviitaleaceae bacterium]|nr:hypothetical protein [Defluviitaleaceae bacterium]
MSSAQKNALSDFNAVLDKHETRIAASKKKVEDIYGGITPDEPYVEYETYGFGYERPHWAKSEELDSLAYAMQYISWRLENFAGLDYIPCVGLPGAAGSGYVAARFGTEYRDLGSDGILITKHAIDSVDKVCNLPQPDISGEEYFLKACGYAEMYADAFCGRVQITYPQLQGASTNALRVLPQEEGLAALLHSPDEMKILAEKVTAVMLEFILGLHRAAGGAKFFRPRGRFATPAHVSGLMVDDWISVVRPETFKRVFLSSYEMMHNALGGIFLHTCGPVLQTTNLLAELPGIEGFETAFVQNSSKTTENMLEMKQAAGGRYTFCSFCLPDGKMAADEENVTPGFVKKMSEGGRFMLQLSRAAYQSGLHKKIICE